MPLAQVRISCLPKSSPPSLASLSLPRDRHASVLTSLNDMTDAPLIANHDVLTTKLNGAAHSNEDALDSPAIDSPATPVDDSVSATVKIDVQSNDQEESDVRHEQVAMKVDSAEDASVVPQVATPADPGTSAHHCSPCAVADLRQRNHSYRPTKGHTTARGG